MSREAEVRREVLEKLKPCKEALVARGSVHWRKDRKQYVVRVRRKGQEGEVVHRTITLGPDPRAAEAAKELIAEWRLASPHGLPPDRCEMMAIGRRLIDRTALSVRQRRRLKQAIREQLQGNRLIEATCTLLSAGSVRRRLRGRPSNAGLW